MHEISQRVSIISPTAAPTFPSGPVTIPRTTDQPEIAAASTSQMISADMISLPMTCIPVFPSPWGTAPPTAPVTTALQNISGAGPSKGGLVVQQWDPTRQYGVHSGRKRRRLVSGTAKTRGKRARKSPASGTNTGASVAEAEE